MYRRKKNIAMDLMTGLRCKLRPTEENVLFKEDN
jgi:hypothetical protein